MLHLSPARSSQVWLGCRGKERELTMLRAALAERDKRLAARARELLRARPALQDKDAELAAAYERLTQVRGGPHCARGVG